MSARPWFGRATRPRVLHPDNRTELYVMRSVGELDRLHDRVDQGTVAQHGDLHPRADRLGEQPLLQGLGVAEGHAVAVHSHTRAYMLMSPATFARTVTAAADHIEQVAGRRPCRAFRPHAGWRSWSMYAGLKRIDYRMIGWSWMLWDWNWFQRRTADSAYNRVRHRIANGDIVVMHDGDEKAPFADQRHTVEAIARLLPELRASGYEFGTICDPNE